MLKFLRKYQAWILAVGGSLLMIAFLLPQAIQKWASPSLNRTVIQLTIDGRTSKVRYREWQQAGNEMAILETMFNTRDLGLLLNFPALDPEEKGSKGLRGIEHWLLLKKQAHLAGLIGGVSDAEEQLRQQATIVAANQRLAVEDAYDFLIQALGREAGRLNLTVDEGKRAFATLAGISRLIDGYAGSALASEARARHVLKAFEERVDFAFIFIDAEKHIADLPEPDEAILQEHYEKYRDEEPGTGEQGFGYRLEDRVKVEYLTIKFQSVYDQVEGSGLEARKWYQRNAPKVAQDPSNPAPFDEVANDAIAAYRRAKAEEIITEISRYIKSELIKQVQPLPRDGQYRALPEDWAQRRVSFETLREEIQARFNATVEYRADTQEWTALSGLGLLEGIGSASRLEGAGNMSLRQLVAAHRELGQEGPPGLQAGLADPDLLRRTEFNRGRVGSSSYPGDAYLYRVLEVDAARPAVELSEVREAVVKDVKRLQAFAGLEADLRAWRQRALDEGLDDLAKSTDTFVRRGGVTRYGTMISKPGEYKPNAVAGITSPTLVEAILGRAATFEPLTKFSDLPLEERLMAVAAPERLGIALVRLESQTPVTRERWLTVIDSGLRINAISQQSAIPLSRVAMYRHFADTEMKPFTFEAMKVRFGFVDLRSEPEPEPSEPEMTSGAEEDAG